jgi:hypothetical protein
MLLLLLLKKPATITTGNNFVIGNSQQVSALVKKA